MNIFFIIAIAIFFVLAIVSIFGLTQPRIVEVYTSKILHQKPEEIFHLVADLREFVKWSPWSEKDPEMKHSFEGEPLSVTSRYSWSGNKKVGQGSLEITHMEANRRVDMKLSFGERHADTSILLEPLNGGSRISWKMQSDMGNNPLARAFGYLMRIFVAKDYNQGLRNLEKYAATR
jgi:hypothetical protein